MQQENVQQRAKARQEDNHYKKSSKNNEPLHSSSAVIILKIKSLLSHFVSRNQVKQDWVDDDAIYINPPLSSPKSKYSQTLFASEQEAIQRSNPQPNAYQKDPFNDFGGF